MTLSDITTTRVPRAYQIDGINWLSEGKRRFLTDGFGLGKTAQAVWAAETPCLIAAPAHLLNMWKREILICRPGSVVRVANGLGFDTRAAQLEAGPADFYVVNIEFLRTDMHIWFEPLRPVARREGRGIKTLIIDEAHRIRGRNSQQHNGAFEVSKRVDRVYLLTATPVFNTPADLFGQLRLLDPARFSSYYEFEREYLAVHQTPYGPKILGLRKNKALKGVFKQFAMGRTREDVKAQLPQLQETVVEIEPDRTWYEQYERLKTEYRDLYGQQLTSRQSVLQVLRGYTQQPKLQAVCELIQDSCASHTLVYTYHKDLAYALGHLLKVPVVTGDMSPGEREGVVRSNDFVVATFPSIAEGVDASHMQNVVFMEHDWQPGLIEQALNRVHRPGNTHQHTNVYHCVVKRSVDSVLYNTYKRRGATGEEIVQAALVPFDPNSSNGNGVGNDGAAA